MRRIDCTKTECRLLPKKSSTKQKGMGAPSGGLYVRAGSYTIPVIKIQNKAISKKKGKQTGKGRKKPIVSSINQCGGKRRRVSTKKKPKRTTPKRKPKKTTKKRKTKKQDRK
jgi:hypothetical protein